MDLNQSKCKTLKTKESCYELVGATEYITKDVNSSRFQIIEERDKGTCDYRVYLQDLYTGYYYNNVYPFSISGAYLYDVPSYDGGTATVLSSSCAGTNIKLTEPVHECFELNATGEKIYQSITVITKIIKNECKVESITGERSYGYWEAFCDYSVAIDPWINSTWEWANDSLDPCVFEHNESETSSAKVPEGLRLRSQTLESNITKLVYDSTGKNAINVKYIKGQARCYRSPLFGSDSSIKYTADVHKGYENELVYTRTYGGAE